MAKEVFARAKAIAKDDIKKLKEFGIKPTAVRVQRVDTRSRSPETTQSAIRRRNRWNTIGVDSALGMGHKQLCLLKAETDRKGKLWRASVMYTS